MRPENTARLLGTLGRSRQVNLCEERSACQVCLGSRFCCRHAKYGDLSGRAVVRLVCVCGRGCRLGDDGEVIR